MTDRVCVMRNGHAEQVGPPEAVYSSPTTAFVAEFVGVMNRLPGRVLDDRVEVLGQVVEFTKTPDAPAIANGQTVDVLVRPESLRVRRASHGWGIVTGRTFLGSTVRLGVMINDGRQIQTELPRQAGGGIDPGTAVDLEISDVPVLVDAPQSSWAGHPPSPARSTPVLVGGADAEAQ
jgi:putative spermidine/putrescine transport system ATP-binding protein